MKNYKLISDGEEVVGGRDCLERDYECVPLNNSSTYADDIDGV